MATSVAHFDAVPDPIDEKLSRLSGEYPDETDRRLRRLLSRVESGDPVASHVRTALVDAESDPPCDPTLMEIDTWWGLQDYLTRVHPSIEDLENDFTRLADRARSWGDAHGAETFTSLSGLIAESRDVGLERACSARAAVRMQLVSQDLRSSVTRADSAALAYLTGRRPGQLADAVAVWHEILMSDRRMRADPIVQLSFFCDAGVMMRDLWAIAPDPVLLDRSVRGWQACLQLFRDDAVFPSACLVNLGPRLDLVALNLGIALVSRYRETQKSEDLDEALERLRGAVLLTSPEAPVFAARLADLGTATTSHSRKQRCAPRKLDSTCQSGARWASSAGLHRGR